MPKRYEESSSEKSRIKVTDTIDSDSTITVDSFKKINKIRKNITKN